MNVKIKKLRTNRSTLFHSNRIFNYHIFPTLSLSLAPIIYYFQMLICFYNQLYFLFFLYLPCPLVKGKIHRRTMKDHVEEKNNDSAEKSTLTMPVSSFSSLKGNILLMNLKRLFTMNLARVWFFILFYLSHFIC